MEAISGSAVMEMLSRTAAELLGSVVLDLFPDVLLAGGDQTHLGFYYDFVFSQPFDQEMLPLVEQRLRSRLKEPLKVNILEMMRENCAAFFLHRKQSLLAQKVAQQHENVVAVAQIDAFYGFPADSIALSLEGMHSIKLLHAFDSSRNTVRLIGAIFKDPVEQKHFVKKYEVLLKKKDHRWLGEELGFFQLPSNEESPVWYPKGVLFKKLLRQWISRGSPSCLPVETPGNTLAAKKNAHRALFETASLKMYSLPLWFCESGRFREIQKEADVWGFFCSKFYSAEMLSLFCRQEELVGQLISCLQMIEGWVKILGFQAYWNFAFFLPSSISVKNAAWLESRLKAISLFFPLKREEKAELAGGDAHSTDAALLELRLIDSIGRSWRGPFLEVDVSKAPFIFCSLEGGVERLVALLIEKEAGLLPFWLSPEQVRVVAIGKSALQYAGEVNEVCRDSGLRSEIDIRPLSLSEKVFDAERQKIPYLLIIGEREALVGQVTVRAKSKQRTLSLERFLAEVRAESVDLKKK